MSNAKSFNTVPSERLRYKKFSSITVPSLVKSVRKTGVVGQDRFVTLLAQQICLQMARLCAYHEGVRENELPRLSGILVTGPTAAGKSFTIRAFCEALGIEQAKFVDCSKLTGEGWRGASVSTHFEELADMQQSRPHMPIIVVWDEVDKLAKITAEARDGFDPQKDFLTFLDGGMHEGAPTSDNGKSFRLDTNYIINIFAGAFTGIEETTRFRITRNKGFGFGANAKALDAVALEDDDLRSRISLDDLIQFGLMREFVGRMSTVIPIRALSTNDIIRIVNNSPNSVQARFQKILPESVRLRITTAAAHLLAEQTLESGVGVRALEQITIEHIGFALEEVREDATISSVVLDSDECRFITEYERRPGYTRPARPRNNRPENVNLAACYPEKSTTARTNKDDDPLRRALSTLYPYKLDDMVALEGSVTLLAETLFCGASACAADTTDSRNARLLLSACISFTTQFGTEAERILPTVYDLAIKSCGPGELCAFDCLIRQVTRAERYDVQLHEWVSDRHAVPLPDAQAAKYWAEFRTLGDTWQSRARIWTQREFEHLAKGKRVPLLTQRFSRLDLDSEEIQTNHLCAKALSAAFRETPTRTFTEVASDLCIPTSGLLSFAKEAYPAVYDGKNADSLCKEHTALMFAKSLLRPENPENAHHHRCEICGRIFHEDRLVNGMCFDCLSSEAISD